MVKGAAMNAECKLIKEVTFDDHIMFVGEIVEATRGMKEPLAYHRGKYWLLDNNAPKPCETERERIKKNVEKHKKDAK